MISSTENTDLDAASQETHPHTERMDLSVCAFACVCGRKTKHVNEERKDGRKEGAQGVRVRRKWRDIME